MKKLNSKFIVSALLVSAMASMSAVSASAADYAIPEYSSSEAGAGGVIGTPSAAVVTTAATTAAETTPVEDTTAAEDEDTTATDTEVEDSDVDAEVDEEEQEDIPVVEVEGDVVTDDIMETALEAATDGEVIIKVTEAATISEAAIGAIAESDVVVTIETNDGIQFTIDPATITEVKAIDLTMDIGVAYEEQTASGVEIPDGAIIIAPAMEGEFGLDITITIPSYVVEDIDTDNVYLFYIDDDGNIYDYSDAVEVNDDGSISATISHASQYVITDEDLLGDEDDEDEDEEDEDIDEGDDEDEDEGDDEDEDEDFDEDEDVDFDEDEDEDVDFSEEDEDGDVISEDEDLAELDDGDTAPADTSEDDQGTGDVAVIETGDADNNPGTGTGIVFGTLAITAASAVALAATSKKRK